MHVDIRIGAVGDPPLFPEVSSEDGQLVGLGILERGTTAGTTSCYLLIKLPNGRHVNAQLTGKMLLGIAGAVQGAMARFGDAG